MKQKKLTAIICILVILFQVFPGITGIGVISSLAGNEPPTSVIAPGVDNSNPYMDINFSSGVYGTNHTALSADKLQLTLVKYGGTVSDVIISSIKKTDSAVETSASALVGGETTIRVFLTISGVPSGVESISITPVDSNSIFDTTGNPNTIDQATSNSLLYDQMAPIITAMNPANGNTSTEVNTNLVITFDSVVSVGSGNIVIKKKSDNSIVETILAEGNQVTGRNTNTITINPANNLASLTEYYVQIDNTSFKDTSGNFFAGIIDSDTWNFRTSIPFTGPTPTAIVYMTPTPTPEPQAVSVALPTPSPTPTMGPTPTPSIIRYVEDKEEDAIVSIMSVVNTKNPDGTISGTAILNPAAASEITEISANEGKSTVVLNIPFADSKVSDITVQLPIDALKTLSKGNIDLIIGSDYSRIKIPQESLINAGQQMKTDLYFQLFPQRSPESINQILEHTKNDPLVQTAIHNGSLSIAGFPQIINTNLNSAEVDLTLSLKGVTLPTSKKARQKFLDTLAVFIEHSDHTKELVKGKAVTLPNGSLGLGLPNGKFSTFTIIQSDSFATKSNDCSVIKVTTPSSAKIKGKNITAVVKNAVDSLNLNISVSKKATWNLYKDAHCTKAISSKKLNLTEGKNKVYLKVTAENGTSSKIYTLIITRKHKK